MPTHIGFMAVRRAVDDGHEWFDARTLSWALTYTQMLASEHNAECEVWAKANPVVRFSEFTITEQE